MSLFVSFLFFFFFSSHFVASVGVLSSQLGQLALRTGPSEPELVTLVLQDFTLRDKGPSLSLEVPRGHDFWRQAKELIRKEVAGAQDAEEVFICVYERGKKGSVELQEARAYWKSECTSCIFFWWGNKPLSPTKLIDELKEGQKRLERKHEEDRKRTERKEVESDRRIRHLEIASSNAQHRQKIWNERKTLRLEELEKQFSGSVDVNKLDEARKMIEKLPENPAKEEELQTPLFMVLQRSALASEFVERLALKRSAVCGALAQS